MGAEESSPQQQQKQPLITEQQQKAQTLSNGPVNVPQNEPQPEPKRAESKQDPATEVTQPQSKPSEPSQTETKDTPPTVKKEPVVDMKTTEPKPKPTEKPETDAKEAQSVEAVQDSQQEKKSTPKDPSPATEAQNNPYVDENLMQAQKEYNPDKNTAFEKKYEIEETEAKSTSSPQTNETIEAQPTTKPDAKAEVKPQAKLPSSAPPKATQITKPKSSPKATIPTAVKKPSKSTKTAIKNTYEPEKASVDVKQQIEEYFHTSYPIHITEDVFNIKTDLIRLRRYFHANPELSWEEFETAKNISNYCESLGLATKKGVGKTGVVAVLHGAYSDGLCIALRADMDALPINEENNHIAYKSRVSGVSHACGHDCHMAILLTVARILSQPKYVKRLHGCVKFIFQPAEEGGAGAKSMVKDGVLNEDRVELNCPQVDEIYGLHVWSYNKMGKIVVKSGALMAGSQRFEIKVVGVGGHGAEPRGTCDTVVALTQLSIQLHSIISRNISPIDCGVVTIGTMHVGDAGNIIAECGSITGTVRYLDNEVFAIIKKRMEGICEGIELSYGVTIDIIWGTNPYPPVINHAEKVENVRRAVNKVFPMTENVMIENQTTMAAEDFSFYLNEKPGCFFFVGCGVDENEGEENKENVSHNTPQKVLRHIEDGDEKKTKIYAHHTPTFRVDERCLIVGVQIMINLVMDLLTNAKVVKENEAEEEEEAEKEAEEEVEEEVEDKVVSEDVNVKEKEEVIEDKIIGNAAGEDKQ